jgi:amidophosphoribosyltransferase
VARGDGRLTHDIDPQEKGPQDACGLFGVWAPGEEVAKLTYFGLYALQHRGQESAGIAVADRGRLTVLRDMGLVTQVFTEQKMRGLHGDAAIGHTRYSTTGSSQWANAQPLVYHGAARTIAGEDIIARSGGIRTTPATGSSPNLLPGDRSRAATPGGPGPPPPADDPTGTP